LSGAGRGRKRRTWRSEQAEWAEWAVSRYAEWVLSLPIDAKLIMLFGSYPKGTFDEDSDLDILVVADKLPPGNEAIDLLTDVPDEIPGGDFEPHPYSPEGFIESLKRNGRAAEALIEGQILHIDEGYRQRLLQAL